MHVACGQQSGLVHQAVLVPTTNFTFILMLSSIAVKHNDVTHILLAL